MNAKRYLLGLATVAFLAACTDRGPMNVNDEAITSGPTFKKDAGARAALLTDVPVTGVLPGGTFAGTMTITHFDIVDDALVVSGVLTGATDIGGTTTAVTQTFSNIALDLEGHHSRCAILNLDLGPLHLDLLGLTVDLNEVILDVAANSGAGNLLGNLLCAVTNLLNPGGGILGSIQTLLDRINDILGGLL